SGSCRGGRCGRAARRRGRSTLATGARLGQAIFAPSGAPPVSRSGHSHTRASTFGGRVIPGRPTWAGRAPGPVRSAARAAGPADGGAGLAGPAGGEVLDEGRVGHRRARGPGDEVVEQVRSHDVSSRGQVVAGRTRSASAPATKVQPMVTATSRR